MGTSRLWQGEHTEAFSCLGGTGAACLPDYVILQPSVTTLRAGEMVERTLASFPERVAGKRAEMSRSSALMPFLSLSIAQLGHTDFLITSILSLEATENKTIK